MRVYIQRLMTASTMNTIEYK